jgi:hypothetical protein
MVLEQITCRSASFPLAFSTGDARFEKQALDPHHSPTAARYGSEEFTVAINETCRWDEAG